MVTLQLFHDMLSPAQHLALAQAQAALLPQGAPLPHVPPQLVPVPQEQVDGYVSPTEG